MNIPICYRKDPLNLQTINGEILSYNDIHNRESKFMQLAQLEQTNKTNLKTREEDRLNLRKLINESIKQGIFPPPLRKEKQMETEISIILNNIYKELQKISSLSIFVMTKQICYKFYTLYPYEMRAPQYIVPAAFLLATRFVDDSYHNFVIEQLVKFYFHDKESLLHEKHFILKTITPLMAYLKDPVKIITEICHQQNKKYVLIEAYKVVQDLEPYKIQSMISHDIADLAINVALDNLKKQKLKQ